MQKLWGFALLVSLMWTTGCGGGSSMTTPPPQPDVNVQISSTTSGPLNVAMSTAFQPAEWDYQFFMDNPGATTTLGNLMPQHVRLQAISQGVPQVTASSWNFSVVDAITQPVLGIGDHSPEFQIAKAPPFMYTNGDNSSTFLDPTFAQFAGYAQNLVEYYSTGGFTAPDGPHVSPAWPTDTITWWGIYNEPNINNSLTPQQYVTMYNEVVPLMHATDPNLKFIALELADFSGQVQAWVPPFVAGVTAQVDVMATHFYSTCDQTDTDATVFATVPGFATDVQFFYSQMKNTSLAAVPVWVLENNVNADYANSNGDSTCNPGQVFVTDQRGSSPFFAAWRPYVFSQLGKAGVQALYHWDFDADAQFGEVNYSNDAIQLSYWVDYWLARMFPSPPGANILNFTNSDDADIEILPVQNPDNSVLIMLANHSVQSPATDNNGPGAPHIIGLDLSALPAFQSGSLLTIDATTSVSQGPSPITVTPSSQMTVTLNGYGVAFLTLK